MDRETRRVNFTKLQDPAETKLRTTRSSRATAASISNYFSTPCENNMDNVVVKQKKNRSKFKEPPPPPDVQINLPCKATNLSTFICNNKNEISTESSAIKKPRESDFFEKSQPKVKKAPKLKNTATGKKQSTRKGRTKGQPKIKSAFLRNEQMFSEIAAQHCRADNFNPDEIELALALSKSEVDSLSGQESEQIVDVKEQESVRSKLQKYGFRTAAKEDYNAFSTAFVPGMKRGKRDKWTNKFTALTLRNPEIQAKKLDGKIQAFLEEQEKYKSMNVVESFVIKPYQLSTKSLKPLQIEPESLICTRPNERETNDLSSFYVTELFEISKVPAGHLLKNWAKIEGRDLSPVRMNERTKARLHRFKEVFDDLEIYFDKLNRKTGNDNENLVRKSLEKHIKYEDHEKQNNELDHLINLIEDNMDEQIIEEKQELDMNSTSSSPIKEPPDKRTKHNLEVKKEESCDAMSSFEIPITQVTRSASPDLFADSDDEDDDAVIPTTETEVNQIPMSESLDNALHNFSLQIHKLYDNKTNDCSDDKSVEERHYFNDQSIIESAEEEEEKLPLNHIIDLTQQNSEENEPILIKKDETILLDDSFDFTMPTDETEKDKENEISFTLSNDIPNSPDKSDSSLLKDIENEPNLFNFQHEKQLNSDFHKQTTLGTKNDCKMDNNDVDDDIFFTDLYEKYNIKVPNNRKSKSFTKLTPIKPQKIRKTCSFTETKSHESLSMESSFKTPTPRTSLSKSVSFSSSNAILTESANSIDLTQNESSSDEDNDDVCILLSDDEINYSIWKADKTLNIKEDQDLVLEEENDFVFNQTSSSSSNSRQKYSLLDEFDNVAKLMESPQKSNLTKTLRLNFEHNKEDNDDDELKAYLLSSQTQSDNSRSPNKSVLSRERAEFGIMDAALSEPFTLSQLETPATGPIVEEEQLNWAEASFLDSPSNIPMTMSNLKRFSSNSNNKFNDFLSDAINTSKQDHEDENVQKEDDEIDEFDKFVFDAIETAFERRDTKKSIVPSGLDQLLTGELNFDASQEIKTTSPTKESTTPTKLVPDKELNIPEEVTVNGSVYKVRICTSPKPDFQMMPESEILKRLYNYGIKPLKRTQAVKMLEFIYNQTHSIMLAATEEPTPPPILSTQIPSTWSKSKSTPSVASNVTAFSSQVSRRLPLTQTKSAIFPKPYNDDDDGSDKLIDNCGDKLELHDAYGDQLLRFAHDLKPDLVADDEWFVLQTNVTKKTPQPLMPLHIAWHNLLCANPKLHECVIMFEPIDLQEIYLFLKKLGYRYDPKDLKTFFDRRCIIFRYDLTAPGKQTQRHIRKPKRTKANIKRS